MNKTTQDIGPDFSKFKNIPPAFAGTIIDWSMGSRDITATVIDLVLRDYLSVIDNRVIRNKKSKPLKNFEKKFIDLIFGQSEALTFEQFSKIAFNREFNNLLKIIADGMMEEGFVDRNFQDKMTDAIKQSVKEIGPDETMRYSSRRIRNFSDDSKPLFEIDLSKGSKPTVIPEWIGKAVFFFLILVIVVVVTLMIFVPIIGIILSPLLFISVFILMFMLVIRGFVGKIKKGMESKLGKGYDWALSVQGKALKENCLNLKRYMETYPLLEDRLANELVAFAISFGLGKVWMKKIGKFNANLNVFLESMNSQGDTMIKFLDLPKYLASFETTEEYKTLHKI